MRAFGPGVDRAAQSAYRITRSFAPRLHAPCWRSTSCRDSASLGITTGSHFLPSLRRQRLAPSSPSANKLKGPAREPLHSGVSLSLASLAAAIAVASALYIALQPRPSIETDETEESQLEEVVEMLEGVTTETQPGRVENLTPEQEDKLRKLWSSIFQVCAVTEQDDTALTSSTTVLSDKTNSKDKGKKRRLPMFRKSKDKNDSDSGSTTSGVSSSIREDDADDKYGQNKQFLDTLASTTPEAIRATIWAMVKHDHPDALILRFLRARKWDVEKALVMFVSTMNWRANEVHVDDEIIKNGEAGMMEKSLSSDPSEKQFGEDFMAQIRMGKSFLHGVDKKGRPICVVRVRFHHQGEQCEESLEKFTVYLIETARMVLRPPIDTATIVFDMTGFSMANMDYTPVKFMIKCFEANYPECLGSVLVHKAPWLFQGIWRIIRGWLDPVVASKVHFTNNVKDVEEFIPKSQIIKELDGEENWVYKYVEPVAGENDKMKDEATRDELLAAREQLYRDYEDATLKWIKSPEDASIKAQRNSIADKLRADYWNLDPYLRARSLYDRTGWIQGDKVTPYPV